MTLPNLTFKFGEIFTMLPDIFGKRNFLASPALHPLRCTEWKYVDEKYDTVDNPHHPS